MCRCVLLALVLGHLAVSCCGPENLHFDAAFPLELDVSGAEDVAILPEAVLAGGSRGPIAFVSCDDRRVSAKRRPDGRIFKLELARLASDFSSSGVVVEDVTPGGLSPFHPHGIGIFKRNDGTCRLFVVNHPDPNQEKHSIVVLDYDDGRLSHVKTVTGDALTNPNDVVPVSETSFYVTNLADGGWFSKGSVVHCASIDAREPTLTKVAGDLSYANGVAYDENRDFVYVSTSGSNDLHTFQRGENGALTPSGDPLGLPMALDNIEIADDGSLWIAGHPSKWKFFWNLQGCCRRSPSQVVRIERDGEGDPVSWKTVYVDDGSQHSAASTAATLAGFFPDGKTLVLLASVFDGVLAARR